VNVPSNQKVSVLVKIRAPPGTQWEAWNADAELNKPYCYQPKGEPEVKFKDDCIKYANFFLAVNGLVCLSILLLMLLLTPLTSFISADQLNQEPTTKSPSTPKRA
jgi:hypothetical protein